MSVVSLRPGLEQRNYERRIRDWRRLGKQWRRWESNIKRHDSLPQSGHSVLSRIAVKGMQPALLLT
jgi:hypothetical protein